MFIIVIIVNKTILYISKLLRSSKFSSKKKELWLYVVTDVNKTYCDDYFAVQTYVKSLHCTPETNVLYVNHISKIKKTQVI